MRREGEEIHADMEEARAGSTPNVVRWVLAIGLLGAIVLLSAIWITGALTSDDAPPTTSDRVAEQQEARGSDTDGIVSDDADRIRDAPAAEGEVPPGRVEN